MEPGAYACCLPAYGLQESVCWVPAAPVLAVGRDLPDWLEGLSRAAMEEWRTSKLQGLVCADVRLTCGWVPPLGSQAGSLQHLWSGRVPVAMSGTAEVIGLHTGLSRSCSLLQGLLQAFLRCRSKQIEGVLDTLTQPREHLWLDDCVVVFSEVPLSFVRQHLVYAGPRLAILACKLQELLFFRQQGCIGFLQARRRYN